MIQIPQPTENLLIISAHSQIPMNKIKVMYEQL